MPARVWLMRSSCGRPSFAHLRVGRQHIKAVTVGAQDNHRTGARLALIRTANNAAPDDAASIEVQRQVGPAFAAPRPAGDFAAFGAKSRGHGFFRGSAIGPGRGGGNVALARQALAEFVIGAAHVLAQGVATAFFVARKVVTLGIGWRSGGLGTRRFARLLAP